MIGAASAGVMWEAISMAAHTIAVSEVTEKRELFPEVAIVSTIKETSSL